MRTAFLGWTRLHCSGQVDARVLPQARTNRTRQCRFPGRRGVLRRHSRQNYRQHGPQVNTCTLYWRALMIRPTIFLAPTFIIRRHARLAFLLHTFETFPYLLKSFGPFVVAETLQHVFSEFPSH